MTTTAVLVEILIVGMQGTIWLALIVLSIFGYDWVKPTLFAVKGWEPIISLLIVAICYTLGTFLDRVADCLFVLFNPERKLIEYPWVQSKAEVAHADLRMEILSRENKATDFLEHLRSRIRIARATAFNMSLITIAVFIFLVSRTNHTSILVLILVPFTGAITTAFCVLFLGVLQVTYSKRLKQAQLTKDYRNGQAT